MTQTLTQWYTASCRPLPFRERPSPYYIWISEIMAQQTRMTALLPYFERFTTLFPTIETLAAASEEQVLDAWTGLGYYARARNLHKTARIVCAQFAGHLPNTRAALLRLPGIGDYTAGAILSIAHNLPEPAVDGNVLRVYARMNAYPENILTPQCHKLATAWVGQLMQSAVPSLLTQALMELGALICTPQSPDCSHCPLTKDCGACAKQLTATLPIRAKPPKQRVEYRTFYLFQNKLGEVLVRRRTERLLHNMWEFPATRYWDADLITLGDSSFKFTHIEWKMTCYFARVNTTTAPDDCVWMPLAALKLPTAYAPYLGKII